MIILIASILTLITVILAIQFILSKPIIIIKGIYKPKTNIEVFQCRFNIGEISPGYLYKRFACRRSIQLGNGYYAIKFNVKSINLLFSNDTNFTIGITDEHGNLYAEYICHPDGVVYTLCIPSNNTTCIIEYFRCRPTICGIERVCINSSCEVPENSCILPSGVYNVHVDVNGYVEHYYNVSIIFKIFINATIYSVRTSR